jgi:hypothetical protein
VREAGPSPCFRRTAVLLVAVAGSSLLDLHTGVHAGTDLLASLTAVVELEASHPEQPAHLESTGATASPHCPACLRELRSGDRALASLAVTEVVPAVDPSIERAPHLAPCPPRREPVSRGPPGA